MNGTAKITTGISIQPGLVEKIDRLAQACGKSRSEMIGRIVGTVIDDLMRPDVGWVKIERNHLMQLLTI